MKHSRVNISPATRLRQYLKEHKMRCTPERLQILDTIQELPARFTADNVTKAVKEGNYHVSPTTVYSTLHLLVDCGMLRRISTGIGADCYERTGTGSAAFHLNLVCRHCGRVRPMRDTELTQSMAARRFASFVVEDYELNVYGACRACYRKLQRLKS